MTCALSAPLVDLLKILNDTTGQRIDDAGSSRKVWSFRIYGASRRHVFGVDRSSNRISANYYLVAFRPLPGSSSTVAAISSSAF